MNNNIIDILYETIQDRRNNPVENSYTCYLFEKGLDKILKKVGEEASEVIIAAKNGKNEDTVNEISDLMYHLMVLMAQQNISTSELYSILEQRHTKSGNLKKFHQVDQNS